LNSDNVPESRESLRGGFKTRRQASRNLRGEVLIFFKLKVQGEGSSAIPVEVRVSQLASAAVAQQVLTESGTISGIRANGLSVYKGIPFAALPVGDLRWRPPVHAAPWTGARKADAFAPACMQVGASMPGESPPAVSEDCLYVNIWTRAKTALEHLPVIVWIYGGGYINGSSSMPLMRRSGRSKCPLFDKRWPGGFPEILVVYIDSARHLAVGAILPRDRLTSRLALERSSQHSHLIDCRPGCSQEKAKSVIPGKIVVSNPSNGAIPKLTKLVWCR
jgi:Carboxylesterase family